MLLIRPLYPAPRSATTFTGRQPAHDGRRLVRGQYKTIGILACLVMLFTAGCNCRARHPGACRLHCDCSPRLGIGGTKGVSAETSPSGKAVGTKILLIGTPQVPSNISQGKPANVHFRRLHVSPLSPPFPLSPYPPMNFRHRGSTSTTAVLAPERLQQSPIV